MQKKPSHLGGPVFLHGRDFTTAWRGIIATPKTESNTRSDCLKFSDAALKLRKFSGIFIYFFEDSRSFPKILGVSRFLAPLAGRFLEFPGSYPIFPASLSGRIGAVISPRADLRSDGLIRTLWVLNAEHDASGEPRALGASSSSPLASGPSSATAKKRTVITASRGVPTRAASSRKGGRHHPGISGRNHPGIGGRLPPESAPKNYKSAKVGRP